MIASKLLARKRPRLIPIYNRVVKTVTGGDRNYWVPLCQALQEDGKALHHRLLWLRSEADLPHEVRLFGYSTVIAWMKGRYKGY